MKTIHFHITQTGLSLKTTLFRIRGMLINNLAPMKVVLSVARQPKLTISLNPAWNI